MREEIADNRDHAALAIQHRRAGRAVIEHEAVMRNFDGAQFAAPLGPVRSVSMRRFDCDTVCSMVRRVVPSRLREGR